MISSLVCNKFRARLSEELVVRKAASKGEKEVMIMEYLTVVQLQKTSHHFAVVDDDERIAPLVKGLQLEHTICNTHTHTHTH